MQFRIAASCAVVAFGIVGAAQAQTVGHVGASYERMHVNGGGDLDVGKIDGAFGFKAGMVGGQVDAQATRYWDGGSVTGYGGTIHLNLHGDIGLIGGFGGMYTSKGETLWVGGAEGQLNLGQAVLYAQAGYGRMDSLGSTDLYGARLEARYYVTDNLKVQASGGYTRLPKTTVGRPDVYNLGAEAEYQMESVPISMLAAYEYGAWRHTGLKSHTFRVGVRYNFGGTLRERDQNGSSLSQGSKLFGGELGQVVTTSFGVINDVLDDLQ